MSRTGHPELVDSDSFITPCQGLENHFCEMPDQVRHDHYVILNSFQNLILKFDIRLTFGF